ncbi:MAG: recombinase zinc beta ribbon domain-containing protein, partial [Clostridia bacterium]|nr:recombinase zinc beta ribbon domain-containing protein [Clostridia bacterium]
SCFASRIVCGDCGAFYGSKVWHSTDEYRRTIWRCNNKYEGDKKCSTPHVTQEKLEKVFVDVMQKVIAEKDVIFAVCREVLDEVLDTSELDRIATRLQDQALGMAERVRKLVEENARARRDQEKYQREYDALAAEHEKLSEKIRSIEEQKRIRLTAGGRLRYSCECLRNRRNAGGLNRIPSWLWWIRWLLGRTENWRLSSETG